MPTSNIRGKDEMYRWQWPARMENELPNLSKPGNEYFETRAHIFCQIDEGFIEAWQIRDSPTITPIQMYLKVPYVRPPNHPLLWAVAVDIQIGKTQGIKQGRPTKNFFQQSLPAFLGEFGRVEFELLKHREASESHWERWYAASVQVQADEMGA
jgi:hypothetical protein